VTEMIQRGHYFYTIVEDKPGVLYSLLEHFENAGVEFVAFSAFPVGTGRSQLDFFPTNPTSFQAAADETGLEVIGPRHAFLVQGDNASGALVHYHRRLFDGGINIHAASGVTDGNGSFGYVLWVKPEDYETAAKTMGLT
jgi:hypothetical protein